MIAGFTGIPKPNSPQVAAPSFVSGSPSPGTYICRTSIPNFYTALITIGATGTESDYFPNPFIDPTKNITARDFAKQQDIKPALLASFRFANVNYYPQWPETGYNSITAAFDDNAMYTRIGRYWDYIGSFGSGFRWAAKGRVYNVAGSYYGDQSSAEEVYVKSTDPVCTNGVIDPQSKQLVYASPGVWRCLQNVAPVVNPSGLPAGTYYNIPQLPYPVDDDPNNPLNYWILIAPRAQCLS